MVSKFNYNGSPVIYYRLKNPSGSKSEAFPVLFFLRPTDSLNHCMFEYIYKIATETNVNDMKSVIIYYPPGGFHTILCTKYL